MTGTEILRQKKKLEIWLHLAKWSWNSRIPERPENPIPLVYSSSDAIAVNTSWCDWIGAANQKMLFH